MNCLIWGVPAEDKGGVEDDYFTIVSHRAGGGYRLASGAHHLMMELDNDKRKKLTSWLVRQREFGEQFPFITAEVVESLSLHPAIRYSDRVNNTLLFFAEHLSDFDKQFHLSTTREDFKPLHLLARTACMNNSELRSFLHLMVASGLLTAHGPGLDSFALTPKGWERIDELQQAQPLTTQAFVAMWFHEMTRVAYSNGFQPAILEADYVPLRIDRKHHINKIDDEIIAEIRRSRFLVADFTCEADKARGGVYFEAGYALALPIPVIWTCHKNSVEHLHFDTRQYAHIVWEEPQDLYEQLKARIGAVIGDGPFYESNRRLTRL